MATRTRFRSTAVQPRHRRPEDELIDVATRPVGRAQLVGATVAVGVAVAAAAATGRPGLLLAVVAVAVLAIAAWGIGLRTFTQFFVIACCARPLVDLTASPRSDGVSVTEVFGLGVLLVMVSWLAVHRDELLPRLRSPLPMALLALVAVYALASFGSTAPEDGVASTLRIAAGVAVFLVTDLLLATHRLRPIQVLQLVLLVNVVPVLYPLLGLLGAPVTHEKDGLTALRSVYVLSNNFAYALLPLLLLCVAWVMRGRGPVRWIAAAGVGAAAVELALTQTRGAWLAAVVGVLIVCALLERRAVVGVLAALAVVALTVPSISARIGNLTGDPDQPYTHSSLAWRLGQWDRLAPDITANPLLGGGPGQSVRLTAKEPHNDYLKAILETGVLGLAVYLAVLGAALLVAWGAWRRVRGQARLTGPDAGALLPAGFAAVAAYSVAVPIGSIGENLVDNVVFLWATLPLLALAHWAVSAPAADLGLGHGPEEPA